MNKYIDINRIEFVITNKCSGKCKHCSVKLSSNNESVKFKNAETTINVLCKEYKIDSVMTFGGEPLLYVDTVCKIHKKAYENNILNRDIITNGYFSRNLDIIDNVARKICESYVTKILLSVDAFHQESIPIEPVINFAKSLKKYNFDGLKTHPVWVVNKNHDNEYNFKTNEILEIFKKMDIEHSNGNNIIPAGNAVKYLSKYFRKPDKWELFTPCGSMPYTEKIDKISSISISPNGNVNICALSIGNIYKQNITEIIEKYNPYNNVYTKLLAEGGVKQLYDYVLEEGLIIDTKECYSSCMLCKKIMEMVEKGKTST